MQPRQVTANAMPMSTAPPATMRADVSFTGFGKLKIFAIPLA
ncbi:MAG: hypothetical protein RL200_1036 [Actinomycetota bacterium]